VPDGLVVSVELPEPESVVEVAAAVADMAKTLEVVRTIRALRNLFIFNTIITY
jgi:hypothetical protein